MHTGMNDKVIIKLQIEKYLHVEQVPFKGRFVPEGKQRRITSIKGNELRK